MNFKKYSGTLIILIVCLLLTFIWFSKGLLFASGEEGIPFYNFNKTLNLAGTLWKENNTGYSGVPEIGIIPYYTFLSILYNLGVTDHILQAIHFLIIISTGTISFYFLLKITLIDELEKRKILPGFQYVSLIGAIFYLFNPFSMSQIWGRSLYMQFFPFAFFPLFLTLYILGLKKKNFIYGFLATISSFLFSAAFGNISYVLSLWFLVLLYTIVYLLFLCSNKKRDVIFCLVFFVFNFIGWLLINMFWIFPFVKIASQQFAPSGLIDTEYNLGSLRAVSKSYPLPNLIRLLHTSYFFEGMYGSSHTTIFFQIISWIIPFVSIFSLKVYKKMNIFKFYAPLYLISFFICLGSNLPTGKLFEFIFTIFPFFQVYRNPFEKFGLVFSITYATFFAIGLIVLANKVKNYFNKKTFFWRTIIIVMFLVNGLYLWPLWIGIFAGGYKINTWVKVPEYYRQANEWLNQQDGDFRMIHYPLLPGVGIRFNWEHSYQGIEPSVFIFDKSSISRHMGIYNKSYYDVLLERVGSLEKNTKGSDPDLTNSQFRSEELYEELAKLDVRYVILHWDVDSKTNGSKTAEEAAGYLSKQKYIYKVKTFGLLNIYKVEIPDNIKVLYSPQTDSQYTKLNPVSYKIHLNKTQDETEIYLLQMFDPGWEAYINNQKIDNHYKVFSYANGWKINQGGDVDIVIKFTPERYVEQGMVVSLITLALLISMSGIYLIWRIRSAKF